jgi:hypothetical protein
VYCGRGALHVADEAHVRDGLTSTSRDKPVEIDSGTRVMQAADAGEKGAADGQGRTEKMPATYA